MQHTWDILTYLIDGCAVSLVLFLIASVFVPALKNIRSPYLRIANTAYAIMGLIPLGILIFFYGSVVMETYDDPIRSSIYVWVKYALIVILLLGLVPASAFSPKRNAAVWFTCLLIVSVPAITHMSTIAEWIAAWAWKGYYFFNNKEAPMEKWYRLLIALLFFVICYWFTRRKISRA
ncbi:hypothetical protein SAMN04488128_1011893 [Chitinophaga eiseniae]|uniref:Uncharacterized protein n=1 Tax=Chitinophaga eiseniae TaxID=634771 RepID=A0A1T4P3S0_9BACT|nr:hypothetical protein [Chitinophaga eiseniae]SJZ86041.1 hypothetical protein SAMN04488128_1011893 [Chitinophaga eiseniae]